MFFAGVLLVFGVAWAACGLDGASSPNTVTPAATPAPATDPTVGQTESLEKGWAAQMPGPGSVGDMGPALAQARARIEELAQQWESAGVSPEVISARRQEANDFFERVESGAWVAGGLTQNTPSRIAAFRRSTDAAVRDGTLSRQKGDALIREYIAYRQRQQQ